MKQSEYLRELKENLETRITPEELKDILSDYESFFISGKEDGKTDDEISRDLGSPAFLAKSLLEERCVKETEQPDKRLASPGRRICAYAIDAIIAVMPASIVSFVAGAIVLPYLLFITYPNPAVGALVYMGYSTHTGYSAHSVTSVTEIKENGEKVVLREDRNDGRKPNPIISILAVVSLAFYLFYSLVCTLLFKGQTIGKKLMHIKVRRSDTGLATGGAIFCWEFLGKTLLNSIPLILLISFFTILFTKEHKALHDMLANTIVSDM